MLKRICVLAFCFFATVGLYGQAPGTGYYPFSSFDSKGFDSVNLGNLNTHFEIPIVKKQGRGLPFNYSLAYDGMVWTPVTSAGTTYWVADAGRGFHGQLDGAAIIGYVTYQGLLLRCQVPDHYGNIYSEQDNNYVYHDAFGANHLFNYSIYRPCPVDPSGNPVNAPPQYSGDGSSADGSGYTYNGLVTARNGSIINPPTTNVLTPNNSITDANGNRISNNGNGVFTDTTGTAELTIAGGGSASSPQTFSYPVVNQANGATSATVAVSYAAYTVQTNFACPGIGESGATAANLVDHISFPDNPSSVYSFTYEATPGYAGSVTGRLKSVTLPTGGKITYSYTGGCSNNGIMADGTTAGLARTTSDGVKTYSRATVNANATTTTTTDEANNVSIFHFSQDATSKNYYETHRQVYQGTNTSGGNLLDQYTCYNGGSGNCDGAAMALPINSKAITTSYNNQAQVLTTEAYQSGLLTSSSVSTPGGPVLESSSIQRNALGEVISQTTSDPSGALVSSVMYGYDETAPIGTGNLPQHVAASAQRGNLTSSTVTTAPNVTLRTGYTNDDAGQVRSITAPNGTTSVSYDATGTYEISRTLPTPSSGVGMATSATYNAAAGVLLNATGVNSGQTITASSYDPLLRATSLTLPIQGAATSVGYAPNQTSVSSVISGTQSSSQINGLDAYGRPVRSAVWNGFTYYITDSCYSPTGLLQSVGLPYASSTFPSNYSCTNRDTYAYDALSRPVSVQHADGSSTTWAYFSFTVTQNDSPGAVKRTAYDMLGRISSVCEVSTNTSMPNSGSPVPCQDDPSGKTGFITSYAYNLASHTTSVTQGAQTRTFQTDMAGRPISTVEPERGATQYSYNYNTAGLVVTRVRPTANQASASTLTTTTTQFDSLDRPVSVSYTDGTPTKTFGYDVGISPWAGSIAQTNLAGQLSYVKRVTAAGAAETVYSYDLSGNIIANDQCQPSGCAGSPVRHQAISYGYDLRGVLTSQGDGTGTTYTFGRSAAGEITGITASPSDATHLANIVEPGTVQNGPFGPTFYTLGNGLNQVNTYDSMGRINGGYTCGNSSSISCNGGTQLYGYQVGRKGQQAYSSSDTVLNRGSSYGYDEFSRLISSTTTAASVQNLTWTYDRYGNRWQQNAPQGGPQPQLSFYASNNQVVGDGYDAAGNMTSDGVHHYSYDADGNLVSVDNGSTAVYAYDALNRRVVVKIPARGTTEFAYDATGHRVSTWNAPAGSLNEGNVYWDGRPVAFKSGGSTHFEHQDWQGTERLRTSYNGTVDSNYVSLPFGDGYKASGNDWDWYHFGGLTHDPDSNTEAATFRQYASQQGHWMSPDPYDGSYDVKNPQSLNRYSFVLDDPLVYDDPDGTSEDGCPSYTCETVTVTAPPPPPEPPTPPAMLPPTIPPGPVGGPGSTGSGTGGSGGGNAPNNSCKIVNGSVVCPSKLDDKANPEHKGKANYRDFNPFCSLHVLVDKGTGNATFHTDLFNPTQSLPAGPGTNVPLVPFHLVFDVLPDSIYDLTGHYFVPAGRNLCP